MCYKENKSLFFFDVINNRQIFPSKVCHFQYDHRFILVEKTGTCKEHLCKCILNLDCQNSIPFGIFKLLKNEESFGKNFSFSFSAKCFDRNLKYLF